MFIIVVDCWDVYEFFFDFYGLFICKNDLWFVVIVDDMGMCVKMCKLNKDCLLFIYNWIIRNCWVFIDCFFYFLFIIKVLLYFFYELIMCYYRNN